MNRSSWRPSINAPSANDELREATTANKDAEKRLVEALKDERAIEDSRMTDVPAKLTKYLDDVDLLIIPRFTTENAMEGPEIEAAVHLLNQDQVKVAKEFMKRGKPVLACLGPVTPQLNPQPGEAPEDFDKRLAVELSAGTDDFEKLLAARGIELGRSLILFEGETKALAQAQFGSNAIDVPPIVLADPRGKGSALKPNPIASALRLTGRTAEQSLDLKLRALRPVSLAPGWQKQQRFAGEFAFTSAKSWNELQPFPLIGRRVTGERVVVYTPKYEPPALNDPKKGSVDEERRGPFPIAVAIENKIPAAWMNEDYDREEALAALLSPLDNTLAAGLTVAADKLDRPKQRTVVFGSGSLFTGKELTPPQEKLLLHTVNWLTHREDRLPKPATAQTPEWHYPRVAMSNRDRILWRYGTWIGMPALVAYFGLLAMMIRRLR